VDACNLYGRCAVDVGKLLPFLQTRLKLSKMMKDQSFGLLEGTETDGLLLGREGAITPRKPKALGPFYPPKQRVVPTKTPYITSLNKRNSL